MIITIIIITSGKTYTQTELLSYVTPKLCSWCNDNGHDVTISAYELRGEKCYDVLSSSNNNSSSSSTDVGTGTGTGTGSGTGTYTDNDNDATTRLNILEDDKGRVHVSCCQLQAKNHDDISTYINTAMSTRLTAPTSCNERSSRSHLFIIINIIIHNDDSSESSTITLRVVDLAGSERYEDTTHHNKDRIDEMKGINYSLGCLKECIRCIAATTTATTATTTTAATTTATATATNTTKYIPYRGQN